jgi:very-short-patch-repair endonuclease
MAPTTLHKRIWALVRRQHGAIARRQLLELGMSEEAIRWRISEGRLHPISRGVYAVGRPELTREGRWMAAVLACGPHACLSHESAAAHWKLRPQSPHTPIDISLSAAVARRPKGIRVHRSRTLTAEEITTHRNIPTTTPLRTLIDLATILTPNRLEAAVNEADVLDLIDPESLRAALDHRRGQPGVRLLRKLLDRHTFRLTESELERRFLRIVRTAGMPIPETQEKIAGRVDFHWPSLGLVVETDGWRYHRTPSRQARDNRRMQAHAAAGRTAIRVSHYEIRYEARRIAALLADLVRGKQAVLVH